MHDHIHRQIAQDRIADQRRAHSFAAQRRSSPAKEPPWIRKAAASAAAKAAMRIERDAARRAIAS